MWSAGIVVAIGVFCVTGNIIASGGFALGYYVVVGILSRTIGKLGVKVLPRVAVQLVLAVGVFALACACMGRGDVFHDAGCVVASGSFALCYYIVFGFLILACGTLDLYRTTWVLLHAALASGLVAYDVFRIVCNGESGFSSGFCGLYVAVIASTVILGALRFSSWPSMRCVCLHMLAAAGLITFACIGQRDELGEAATIPPAAKPEAKSHESQDKKQSKEDKVRDFALREAPRLWKAYQIVSSFVEERDKMISELRKQMEMFGVNADSDADLRKLIQVRDEMRRSQAIMKARIEEAYLQSRKFAAAPDSKEFEELKNKCVEEGVAEAKKALTRITAMKQAK